MKKKILFLLAVIAINVVVITTISSKSAYAADGLWSSFHPRYCWCPGDSYPDPQNCQAAECVGGILWVCLTSWPSIPCGEPFVVPTGE